MRNSHWLITAVMVAAFGLVGCKSDGDSSGDGSGGASGGATGGKSVAESSEPAHKSAASYKATGKYITAVHKGGVHVAMEGTEQANELKANGHLAKPVTAVGARHDGMKVYADSEDTLAAFLGWDDEPQFVSIIHKEQLHIAVEGSEGADQIAENGHIAKPVTAVGARVDGLKVMAPDEQTLAAYLGWNDEPQFIEKTHKNELHIALAGTDAANELRENGHIAKPVTAVGARVDGRKVMAADEETLALYLNW